MSDPESMVTFRFPSVKWQLVQMITRRMIVIQKDGTTTTASGSSVLRELLNDWLDSQASEWFPKILQAFKEQRIRNATVLYMERCIREYAESARINNNTEELEQQKERMLSAGFSEEEYDAILKGEG